MRLWHRFRLWLRTKQLVAEFRNSIDSFSFNQFQKPNNPKEHH